MVIMPDYYAILGVSVDADTTAIKSAYRRLAKLHHPDLNPDTDGRRFKEINEAADTLSDPSKRERYDRERHSTTPAVPTPPPPPAERSPAYQAALRQIERCRANRATELHLHLDTLTHLPDELYRLTHLEDLVLRGDWLTHLPSQIVRLHGLKGLHLQTRRLTTLPDELSYLPCLEALSLNCDALDIFPPVLKHLEWLKRLTITAYLAGGLSPDTGELRALESLDLHAGLTELPPEIGRLAYLRKLNLARNDLMHLPKEIGLLPRLEWLKLDHNRLIDLPPELGQLRRLRRLELAHNQLETLPLELGDIDWTEDGRVLDVTGNPLSEFAGISPEEVGKILVEDRAWVTPLEWLWQRARRKFRRR